MFMAMLKRKGKKRRKTRRFCFEIFKRAPRARLSIYLFFFPSPIT